MSSHLPILPLLLPFLGGLLLLALRRRPLALRRALGLALVLGQIAIALALLGAVADGSILSYQLGNWPAPWGIVLVADRLAAGMLLLTSLLAALALLHAGRGIDGEGHHFHSLFQLQLFGLAGAFLTGDLFNLFVFFEVLLLASYGLLLHGGGPERIRAGLHYVVLNLLGSTLFLFAAGVLYASLGTLNLADLAERAASAPADQLGLVRTGGLLLLGVFALKAALLPLHLWLPAAYAHTSAPVAALFAIMTKVGAYAILRVHTLVFGPQAGGVADLYGPWLLPLALATLLVGTLGALAASGLARQIAYLVVASIGSLLTAYTLGSPGVAAGLYYLAHSTLAAAALFLLCDAIARRRGQAGDRLTLSSPDLPALGLWGGIFLFAAVLMAGLPPFSGFFGKLLILRAALDQPAVIWVFALILGAALLQVIALARSGSRLFLNTLPEPAPGGASPPLTGGGRELIAIGGLLALTLALTLGAGPVLDYTRATAGQLADPAQYISAVLGPRGGQP